MAWNCWIDAGLQASGVDSCCQKINVMSLTTLITNLTFSKMHSTCCLSSSFLRSGSYLMLESFVPHCLKLPKLNFLGKPKKVQLAKTFKTKIKRTLHLHLSILFLYFLCPRSNATSII